MTRTLKEKTIPIKLEEFVFYCALSITILSYIGFFYFRIDISIVGMLVGTIFTLLLASTTWDINPIHAIGYCLRWKR